MPCWGSTLFARNRKAVSEVRRGDVWQGTDRQMKTNMSFMTLETMRSQSDLSTTERQKVPGDNS